MRNLTRLVLVAFFLLAGAANAQFANKSLGISAGYMNLAGTNTGIDHGVPVGITASLYMENGFDLVFELGAMILHAPAASSNTLGLDVTPIGFRYLFAEESFRPYLGVDLSYLHIFGDTSSLLNPTPDSNFVGIGPNLGFEYFVSESVSLGLKVKYNVYFSLNSVGTSFNATAHAATYF